MKKLFLSMAALSLPSWAHAQAVVDRAAAFLGETEPIPEPEFRVVGFQDRPGDGNCDPYYASLGLCIEVVDFIPVEDLWRDSAQFSSTAVIQRDRNAQLRSMGKAYSVVLDSLALEWFRDDGPIATSLREDGYDNLPGAPDLWHVGMLPKRVFSLPDREAWLTADRWMPPGGVPTSQGQVELFKGVRYVVDPGLPSPAPMVVVAGRFAKRLGVDNKPYPFDIMAGTANSSGPFFEQLFPYDTERASKRKNRMIPLHDFTLSAEVDLTRKDAENWDVVREALDDTMLQEDEWSEYNAKATNEFELFSRLMGVQVAKNAMMDHTDNQMRILTSLSMMRSPPPREVTKTALDTRGLVAAALGQTDSDQDVLARAERGSLSIGGGFKLRYQQLPTEVIDWWLRELEPGYSNSKTFWTSWNQEVVRLLGSNLRPSASRSRLEKVDDQHMLDWLREQMKPGADRVVFLGDMKIAALKVAIQELSDERRAQVETWILLDHVDHAISADFDPTPGVYISPGELVGSSSGHWASVLSQHGYFTKPLPQGLGGVDPTSICTTLDGRAAMDEPVVGAVNLDLLVMGTDGYTKVEDVLWEARDELPFMLIDDPNATSVELNRLVGLPSGRALYQVRYAIWSGWHVFWSREVLPTGHMRLMAHTGAVCADMVLTNPDLVPTLVRAGLLDGNFRPTDPAFRREALDAGGSKVSVAEEADADVVVQDMDDAADTSKEASEDVTETIEDLKNPEQGIIEKILNLVNAYKGDAENTVQDEKVRETVTYIRELIREPLRQSEQGEGLIVAVVDSSEADHLGPMRDLIPRTPYARVQSVVDGKQAVRGSAWAWYMHPDRPTDSMIGPGYSPRESVANGALIPRWKQEPKLDWTMSGGAAFFPLRNTRWSCSEQSVDLDVVMDCDPAVPGNQYSEGFGFDFSALATLWLLDRPRMAVEWGLEGRIDIVHPGVSWFYESDPPIPYSLAIRPQGGFLGGIRLAPTPHFLMRRFVRLQTWGSERSDGTSNLGRTHYGLRGGLLFGPTFNGVEATIVSELWAGRTVRSPNSPHARFTPYHPALMIGPYIRTQWGFVPELMKNDYDQYLELDRSFTLLIGIRGNLRLKAPGPQPNVGI